MINWNDRRIKLMFGGLCSVAITALLLLRIPSHNQSFPVLINENLKHEATSTPTSFGPYDGHSFSYLGKPINPFCVGIYSTFALDGTSSVISLPACYAYRGASDEDNIDIPHSIPDSDNTSPPRLIGVSYPNMSGWEKPYDNYTIDWQNGNEYLIETESGGGGTGRFTQVSLLRKDGDVLKVERVYTGGDRCTWGVVSVSTLDNQHGTITITQNVTPRGLIEIFVPNIDDSIDLDSSAISCMGTLTLTYDLRTGERHLAAFETEQEYLDGIPNENNADVQSCFDALLKKRSSQVGLAFTAEQTKQFVNDFFAKCEPGMHPVFK